MAPARVLVVRNDKLGDFVLALPTFALLARDWPGVELVALVPAYTEPIASLSPWIHAVAIDPGPSAGVAALARTVADLRCDAAITLFSTTRVAAALWRARIPYRLAPATKFAQFLYTDRHRQRRSRSAKPEWQYNVELARRALVEHGFAGGPDPEPPFLSFAPADRARLAESFRARHAIPHEHRLVVVHPGHGGSARNLDVEQYARFVLGLRGARPFTAVVTAGPGEEAPAEQLAERLRAADQPAFAWVSREGLARFAAHLDLCDLFVGGSTGPLHVAGALDRPTCGFYPRRRSSTALRWQTLNRPERRAAFSPPATAGESELGAIDLDAAARTVRERFLA